MKVHFIMKIKRSKLFSIFFIVVLLIGLTYIFGFHLTESHEEPSVTVNGFSLPDFEFKDIYGRPFKFSHWQGKVLLINFWASWCAPCVSEFSELVKLAEAMKNQLVIVAISNDANVDDINQFLAKQNKNIQQWTRDKNFLIVWDDQKISQRQFGVLRLPETYLINSQGKIVQKFIGEEKWNSDEFRHKIADLSRDSG